MTVIKAERESDGCVESRPNVAALENRKTVLGSFLLDERVLVSSWSNLFEYRGLRAVILQCRKAIRESFRLNWQALLHQDHFSSLDSRRGEVARHDAEIQQRAISAVI